MKPVITVVFRLIWLSRVPIFLALKLVFLLSKLTTVGAGLAMSQMTKTASTNIRKASARVDQ